MNSRTFSRRALSGGDADRDGASARVATRNVFPVLDDASGVPWSATDHSEPAKTPDSSTTAASYATTLPVRPGHRVQLSNLPTDLTAAEAERLAQFVRLLAAE